MPILTVGPGQQFATISDAVAAAQSGDTINVQAGTYTNDFPPLIDKNLTLQGVGGMVKMVATENVPNLKAILDAGAPGVVITINNFDISGAVVPDGNGAAVRYEGGILNLNNDDFHNNQDGLLGAPDPTGTITVNHSEFADNGVGGTGFTHNIYVGDIAQFTAENSLFTGVNVGHEIKSRAESNLIEDNRIQNGPTGTGSYDIDLPNGGDNIIRGNTIEKGPNAQNPVFVTSGEEGGVYANSSLTVEDNTFLNDNNSGSNIAVRNDTTVAAVVANNSVWDLTPAQMLTGPGTVTGTTTLTTEPLLDTSPPFICFCSGTGISTLDGEVLVENLSIGDEVVTAFGKTRRITWIGVGKVRATRGHRTAATPVIVCKGALANAIPNRDLHITKGHSLFLSGALIPVEFLVNHRSIRWDDRAQEVSLYHIELETHDVLIANGAPAESYRDDGNRWLFQNANSGWHLPPQEPCAPVLTGGPIVDAIWQRLLERAGPRPGFPVTGEHDLHLLVDGDRVDAGERYADRFRFHLETGFATARIVSRAASPSELGVARDPRVLGVAVRSIAVTIGAETRRIQAADPLLRAGFHGYEPAEGVRWTDGDAAIPAGLFEGCQGPIDIEVVTSITASYLDEGKPAGGVVRA